MYAMTSEQQQAVMSWLVKHPEMWCDGADLVAPQTAEPGIPSIEIYPTRDLPLPDGISWPDRWILDDVGVFWERKVEWQPSPLFAVRIRQVRQTNPNDEAA